MQLASFETAGHSQGPALRSVHTPFPSKLCWGRGNDDSAAVRACTRTIDTDGTHAYVHACDALGMVAACTVSSYALGTIRTHVPRPIGLRTAVHDTQQSGPSCPCVRARMYEARCTAGSTCRIAVDATRACAWSPAGHTGRADAAPWMRICLCGSAAALRGSDSSMWDGRCGVAELAIASCRLQRRTAAVGAAGRPAGGTSARGLMTTTAAQRARSHCFFLW
jgi:hypothetical protein